MYALKDNNKDQAHNNAYACGLPFIERFVKRAHGAWQAGYGRYRLYSHFQPIYSLAHQEVVGYEGLLRARGFDEAVVPPSALFDARQDLFDDVFLDRLSRYLHTHNFAAKGNDHDWLFLNISPHVVVGGRHYGDFFRELLLRTGIDPRRVVVEIVEEGIEDEERLAEAIQYYRGLGCLVAIDDFGKGHSNFSRIWQLQPEMVKLDQSFIRQATGDINARRILKRLISLIHESGSLALLEGVESESEALLAIDSGTDFVQGYYFARPSVELQDEEARDSFHGLCQSYRHHTQVELERNQNLWERYRMAMHECAESLKGGGGLETACRPLFALPYIKRCYLLDRDGWIKQHHSGTELVDEVGSKFIPVRRDKGMVWSQWREFMQAWQQDGGVYTGKPHLSIKDSILSRTLYLAVEYEGAKMLLGCDVDAIGFEHGESK